MKQQYYQGSCEMKIEEKYNKFGPNRKDSSYFITKLQELHEYKYQYIEEEFSPELETKVNRRIITRICPHGSKRISYKNHSRGGGKCIACEKGESPKVSLKEKYSENLKLKIGKLYPLLDTSGLEYISERLVKNVLCRGCDSVFDCNPKNLYLYSETGCKVCDRKLKLSKKASEYSIKLNKKFNNLTLLNINNEASPAYKNNYSLVCECGNTFNYEGSINTLLEFVNNPCNCKEKDKQIRSDISTEEIKLELAFIYKDSPHLSFDKAECNKARDFVIVNCVHHEDFTIRVDTLLKGRGCPKCAKLKRRISYKQAVEKAIEVHRGLYKYSEQEPKDFLYSKGKIAIECPVKDHGVFYQNMQSHCEGSGCHKCAGNVLKTKEEVVREANEVHGNFYTYEKFQYSSMKGISLITCPLHTDFPMSMDSHIHAKANCPDCVKENNYIMKGFWSEEMFIKNPELKEREGFLYFIKLTSNTEEFAKIGITAKHKESDRFFEIERESTYKVTKLLSFKLPIYKAYLKEQEVLSIFKKHSYTPLVPFPGKTECLDIRTINDITGYLEASVLQRYHVRVITNE